MKIDDHIQIILHLPKIRTVIKPYLYALTTNYFIFSEYQIEQVYENYIAQNGYYAKGNYRCAQAM